MRDLPFLISIGGFYLVRTQVGGRISIAYYVQNNTR